VGSSLELETNKPTLVGLECTLEKSCFGIHFGEKTTSATLSNPFNHLIQCRNGVWGDLKAGVDGEDSGVGARTAEMMNHSKT
jgi:hypothetical protein